jgi:hypothetical protein
MAHPLLRFLAKIDKGIPSVLRYGNRAQAEAKRTSIAGQLAQQDSASAVVQVESRFLIAIFPAEYDFDQKSGKLLAKRTPSWHKRERLQSSQPPFATVSGPRVNPRNRHNQNGADALSGPVYCQPAQGTTRPEAPSISQPSPSRRAQYRAVSDRLNGRG